MKLCNIFLATLEGPVLLVQSGIPCCFSPNNDLEVVEVRYVQEYLFGRLELGKKLIFTELLI